MYNSYYGQNDPYGYPAVEPNVYRYDQRQEGSYNGAYGPEKKRMNPCLYMLFSELSVFALLGLKALARFLINGDGHFSESEFLVKSFFIYIIYTVLDYIYLIVPFVFAFAAYKQAKNRVLFVASSWSSVVIFHAFYYMTKEAWTYFRWQGYIGDTVLMIAKVILCITSIVLAGCLAVIMIRLNEKSPEAEAKTIPALRKDGVYWIAGILPALFTVFTFVLSFLLGRFSYQLGIGDELSLLYQCIVLFAKFAYIGVAYGLASYFYQSTNQRLVCMLAVLGCISINLNADQSSVMYYLELFILEKILPSDIYYHFSSGGTVGMALTGIVMISAVTVLLIKIADGSIRFEFKR